MVILAAAVVALGGCADAQTVSPSPATDPPASYAGGPSPLDAVHLAGVREAQRLEGVVVLAVDDDVVRLVAAALDGADGAEPRQHRLAEVGDDYQRVER